MTLFKTAALAVAVSMIGLSVVGDVAAKPKNGWERIYYSDASHTTEVGEGTLLCSGFQTQTGTVTVYYHEITWVCYTGGDPL